ncbi:MAG: hypothetical protein M1409_07615 [Actinobacteria bacterium]|nr:hypothetical protein [Actinomycetota bacterium]
MANFLKNFKQFFSSSVYSPNENFLKLKIKCKKCSEEINVNLRRTSDFSRVYEEDNPPSGTAFFLRKEILGNKCNNLIYITIYLDESFNIISKEIQGGEFL